MCGALVLGAIGSRQVSNVARVICQASYSSMTYRHDAFLQLQTAHQALMYVYMYACRPLTALNIWRSLRLAGSTGCWKHVSLITINVERRNFSHILDMAIDTNA